MLAGHPTPYITEIARQAGLFGPGTGTAANRRAAVRPTPYGPPLAVAGEQRFVDHAIELGDFVRKMAMCHWQPSAAPV